VFTGHIQNLLLYILIQSFLHDDLPTLLHGDILGLSAGDQFLVDSSTGPVQGCQLLVLQKVNVRLFGQLDFSVRHTQVLVRWVLLQD
jgi:hypothetical protein